MQPLVQTIGPDRAEQIIILSATAECRTTFLHQRFELFAYFLAGGPLSLKLLLQSVHVINPRTDARERRRIANVMD